MSSKKEKHRLKPIADGKYQRRNEYQVCSAPGCRNVVASWAKPKGDSGPIYCTLCAPRRERS